MKKADLDAEAAAARAARILANRPGGYIFYWQAPTDRHAEIRQQFRCALFGHIISDSITELYPIRMCRDDEHGRLFNASDICVALSYKPDQSKNWIKRNADIFKIAAEVSWPGGNARLPSSKAKRAVRTVTTLAYHNTTIASDTVAFIFNEACRRQCPEDRIENLRAFICDQLQWPIDKLSFKATGSTAIAVRCVEGRTLDYIRASTCWASSKTQHIFASDGFSCRVDCFYPAQKLVIECDESQHATEEATKSDIKRAKFLDEKYGVRVIAYTPLDANFRLHEFVGLLSKVLIARSLKFNVPLENIEDPKPIACTKMYEQAAVVDESPMERPSLAAAAAAAPARRPVIKRTK